MTLKRTVFMGVTAFSAAAFCVTGTLAWTNFSSEIINEWHGGGNGSENGPGATLHDDHTDNDENKDVYIENWGSEPLVVRIRLSEYMEMGKGAGLKAVATVPSTGQPVRDPENYSDPLVDGADIDRPDTWAKHIPGGDMPALCEAAGIHKYWKWDMGGQKYYFPVSDASKEDSGYVDQNSPDNLTADSVNSGGVRAKQTLPAQVLTMAQWVSGGSHAGNYWVIDTDGWAYWVKPLMPGEATGLLLDKVTLITAPKQDYYYGIYVDAQMATIEGTKNDNPRLRSGIAADNYMRFGEEEQGGWTDNGRVLVDKIVSSVNQSTLTPSVTPMPSCTESD